MAASRPYVPFMQGVFKTEPVAPLDGALVVGVGIVLLLLVELERAFPPEESSEPQVRLLARAALVRRLNLDLAPSSGRHSDLRLPAITNAVSLAPDQRRLRQCGASQVRRAKPRASSCQATKRPNHRSHANAGFARPYEVAGACGVSDTD